MCNKKGVVGKDAILNDSDYNKDLKERMGQERGSKIESCEKLQELFPELYIWLQKIYRYQKCDDIFLIYINYDIDKVRFTVVFYTDNYQYSIYGHKDGDGYLGAGFTTRKPRVGENWNRGNDLPDGKYHKDTFNEIVCAILSNEIVKLELWRK